METEKPNLKNLLSKRISWKIFVNRGFAMKNLQLTVA
jgi:hypothetical protein